MEALFARACRLLPDELGRSLRGLSGEEEEYVEELRLRVGQPLCLGMKGGEKAIKGTCITEAHLESTLDIATSFSRYTAAESIRNGYFTAEGGFRVGICGSAILSSGEVQRISPVSSLSIRIPRQCFGAAAAVLPGLMEEDCLAGTLILSPPGVGKTTLLRDMIRLASLGGQHGAAKRVCVVDERGELAALWRGRPQFDLGPHTDILDGCGKGQAIPILLRAMNPQIIALDEIARMEDVEAVKMAAGCGVTLLATCHARNREELEKGSVGQELLTCGVFRRIVTIRREATQRMYSVEEIG